MENTELQSTIELIDNIEFEEKVDFENLVLSSEPTDIPNLETIDIQGPPLGIDIMYLVLADRNMQVRFGLKVVWGS